MALPPPSHTSFASWSGTPVMSWAQHAMTVGHCAIHLGGWGCYKPPPPPSSSMVESWWRSRGRAPWKLQRICILRYLGLGLILPNNTWIVMHFFMCIAVRSHRNSQRSKIFNSQVSYQKKMCMFYSSSWITFLKFKRQAM